MKPPKEEWLYLTPGRRLPRKAVFQAYGCHFLPHFSKSPCPRIAATLLFDIPLCTFHYNRTKKFEFESLWKSITLCNQDRLYKDGILATKEEYDRQFEEMKKESRKRIEVEQDAEQFFQDEIVERITNGEDIDLQKQMDKLQKLLKKLQTKYKHLRK